MAGTVKTNSLYYFISNEKKKTARALKPAAKSVLAGGDFVNPSQKAQCLGFSVYSAVSDKAKSVTTDHLEYDSKDLFPRFYGVYSGSVSWSRNIKKRTSLVVPKKKARRPILRSYYAIEQTPGAANPTKLEPILPPVEEEKTNSFDDKVFGLGFEHLFEEGDDWEEGRSYFCGAGFYNYRIKESRHAFTFIHDDLDIFRNAEVGRRKRGVLIDGIYDVPVGAAFRADAPKFTPDFLPAYLNSRIDYNVKFLARGFSKAFFRVERLAAERFTNDAYFIDFRKPMRINYRFALDEKSELFSFFRGLTNNRPLNFENVPATGSSFTSSEVKSYTQENLDFRKSYHGRAWVSTFLTSGARGLGKCFDQMHRAFQIFGGPLPHVIAYALRGKLTRKFLRKSLWQLYGSKETRFSVSFCYDAMRIIHAIKEKRRRKYGVRAPFKKWGYIKFSNTLRWFADAGAFCPSADPEFAGMFNLANIYWEYFLLHKWRVWRLKRINQEVIATNSLTNYSETRNLRKKIRATVSLGLYDEKNRMRKLWRGGALLAGRLTKPRRVKFKKRRINAPKMPVEFSLNLPRWLPEGSKAPDTSGLHAFMPEFSWENCELVQCRRLSLFH